MKQQEQQDPSKQPKQNNAKHWNIKKKQTRTWINKPVWVPSTTSEAFLQPKSFLVVQGQGSSGSGLFGPSCENLNLSYGLDMYHQCHWQFCCSRLRVTRKLFALILIAIMILIVYCHHDGHVWISSWSSSLWSPPWWSSRWSWWLSIVIMMLSYECYHDNHQDHHLHKYHHDCHKRSRWLSIFMVIVDCDDVGHLWMRTPRLRTTRDKTTWPAAATKPCNFFLREIYDENMSWRW